MEFDLNLAPTSAVPCRTVLYVEDEETDVLLLRLTFERAKLLNPVASVADGVKAIEYLAGAGPFADRNRHPVPALVLLDLNLPRVSGFEVLEWVRSQPQFASLPVIIYTSSGREADREKARQLGATDYLVKPSDVNELTQLIVDLSRRWLAPAVPPK
jgi:CheY-like chemotaxis protein